MASHELDLKLNPPACDPSGMRLVRLCIGFSLLFFLCCGGSEPGGESGVITVGGVSATQGGTLASDSGEVKLQVPSGALDIPDNPATGDAELQVEVRAAEAETAGPIYKFSPEGLVFRTPAALSIRLDKEVPAGKTPVIALRDGDSWVPYPGSVVEGNVVRADVRHFSEYSVIFVSNNGSGQALINVFNDRFISPSEKSESPRILCKTAADCPGPDNNPGLAPGSMPSPADCYSPTQDPPAMPGAECTAPDCQCTSHFGGMYTIVLEPTAGGSSIELAARDPLTDAAGQYINLPVGEYTVKVRYDGANNGGYFNQGATLVVNEAMGMLTATSNAPVKSAPGLPAEQKVIFAEDVTYDLILRMSSTTGHPLDGNTVALDIVQGDTVTDLKSQANCNNASNTSGFSCSATRPLLLMPVSTETKRFEPSSSSMQACHPACESAGSTCTELLCPTGEVCYCESGLCSTEPAPLDSGWTCRAHEEIPTAFNLWDLEDPAVTKCLGKDIAFNRSVQLVRNDGSIIKRFGLSWLYPGLGNTNDQPFFCFEIPASALAEFSNSNAPLAWVTVTDDPTVNASSLAAKLYLVPATDLAPNATVFDSYVLESIACPTSNLMACP